MNLTSPLSRVPPIVSILDFCIIKQHGTVRSLQEYYTGTLVYVASYFSENTKYFFVLTLKLQKMQVFVNYGIPIGTFIYIYQAGKTCKSVTEQRQLRILCGLERFVYSGEQCWDAVVLNNELDSAEVGTYFFFLQNCF